uniref:F-box domain-containing protein n=1 Tax=Citrus limon TaxID=2708 RepID=A0A1S8ADW2_CITLI
MAKLPQDLINVILSWPPVKSLLQLRVRSESIVFIN